MKGPLRRISRRRPDEAAAPEPPSPQEPQPTLVASPVVESPPTVVAPAAEPLPAGLAPEDVAPSRPSFRDRGRLRRRLRYLRRVRELGFRDLGGLAFDLHRFARRNDELVLGKLAALDAVDRELRAIERVLDERRDIIELREPGVAACPRCGALHGSDARFCPQCGTQFRGPLAMVEVGGVAALAQEPSTVSTPAAATPVSGALAGNPPPEAPPEEPATTVAPGAAASGGEASGEQSATGAETPGGDAASGGVVPGAETSHGGGAPSGGVVPGAETTQGGDAPSGGETTPNADAPTQAFSALGEGNGSSVTGGDPLAQRERKDA